MASHFEHMKGLLGTDSDVPPLGQAMVVAADELWPHKVKMNTGEFSDIPPECVGGLLLDWLEHLQVPIVQHPKVVLATGAAFNALPLLTLRTLECIFNLTRTLLTKLLSEHTHATASTTATICDAVVGRTTMACLQLSAGAAKPYFSKVRHLLDTWTCPKPLPLNDGRIAELNLAPVDAAGRFDSPMDRGAVGHGSYSSTSLHDGETSKWDQNPHQPLSPAHASSAPHVGDSSGLPPVKPPSPAHPPPPSGAFSSSFVAANTIKNTDDAGENHVTLDDMSKSTSPVLGDTELTPSTNSSASLHSVGESKLLSPLHQSSSSPTKECSMEPPLLLSVKGSVPRSLPALHIPRKQSAAQ
ncbi:hypothetical protein DYB35_004244 [Aphanomyces astaci]|uniref:Uncharacterized protein n=1 Tax=Aphanomyces astaci TaxID=112090 RepID=A0A3R6WJN6_APHAT|nr:hypothetical protein DYB35_004244 [Aphanomyces astaci]